MKSRGLDRSRIARSRARAWAAQVLYQWDVSAAESPVAALQRTLGSRRVGDDRIEYLRRLVDTYDANREEIDDLLRGALDKWRLERLAAMDRAILRVAATELSRLSEDVPKGVAIHEAVLLAERYSGHDAPPFVNGVLEALVRGLPVGPPSPP